VANIFCRSK